MSTQSDNNSSNQDDHPEVSRCPNCDSVVGVDDKSCSVCFTPLVQVGNSAESDDEFHSGRVTSFGDTSKSDEKDGETSTDNLGYIEHTLEEKQSPLASISLIGMVIFFAILALWVLQNPGEITFALLPTETSLAPTQTLTPTWTPLATETIPPEDTPTSTPIPQPTDTPQPPRLHQITAGETLFSLSLRYGVTVDSIASLNGILPDSGLQVSQELVIPWPTATPELEQVAVEVGGETIIADPTDCRMYQIMGGDTFFGISARERVPLEALMAVNRLTEQSILQPGDRICIPEIIRGGVLPATPGPSPTAMPTSPPPGPQLLYPIEGQTIQVAQGQPFLQWVAVKALADDEWYMVEIVDLSAVDSHPYRGFTRQTSFQIPYTWRAPVPEIHTYRWSVRIVLVTSEREDGSFIYTFGGSKSEDAMFQWMGAVPTATRVPSPTPVSEEVGA